GGAAGGVGGEGDFGGGGVAAERAVGTEAERGGLVAADEPGAQGGGAGGVGGPDAGEPGVGGVGVEQVGLGGEAGVVTGVLLELADGGVERHERVAAGGVEVATVGGDLGLDASERGQRGDDENQKRHQHDGDEQREAAAWPVDPVAGRARKHDGGRDGLGAGDGSASATGGDGTGQDRDACEQRCGGGLG